MRFLKEIVALIIISVFVIGSDIFISKITKESLEKVNNKINEISEIILNDEKYNKEEELKKIEDFEKEWNRLEENLAFFVEHDELEKLDLDVTIMKANMKVDMKKEAFQKMEEIKFVIDHIKTKQKMKLNNIF